MPWRTPHLGDRDGLLLHGLMDRHAVVFSHLHGREKRPSDPARGSRAVLAGMLQHDHFQVPALCQASGRTWVPSHPGDKCMGLTLLSLLSRCGNRLGDVQLLPSYPIVTGKGLNTSLQVRGGFCCPGIEGHNPCPESTRCPPPFRHHLTLSASPCQIHRYRRPRHQPGPWLRPP